MAKHTCPVHNETLVFKQMHAGGWAEVCPTFASTECRVFFDRRTERFYNVPGVVAPASTLRGRVTSLRAKVKHDLMSPKFGFSAEDAEEMIDVYGVLEMQKLIAA